jgi:hypothetical protein
MQVSGEMMEGSAGKICCHLQSGHTFYYTLLHKTGVASWVLLVYFANYFIHVVTFHLLVKALLLHFAPCAYRTIFYCAFAFVKVRGAQRSVW